ncbi:MAG: sigma-54-dependent Fis family transcriptional regulator [Rhodospirillales bacterium]|nr:sigma-54-dependent Fis family transcriptional regulator [Rhodospirillales bacterium]
METDKTELNNRSLCENVSKKWWGGTTPNVLIADAATSQALVYAKSLQEIGLNVTTVATGRGTLDELEKAQTDLVILDMDLPDIDGLQILKHISARQGRAAAVVTSSNGSLNGAIRALRLGAYDYLVKPFGVQRLIAAARDALDGGGHGRQMTNVSVDGSVAEALVGSSPPMRAVHETIRTAAASKATVFVTGESGTGKEVVARLIHGMSPRRDKPHIAINCSAIPRDLIESEVFGHVKGAFTGAVRDRAGAAIQADGGTLFLDEICEMNWDLQAKLLRFLQDGTIRRVGATKSERVDVRIICATNRDPANEVQAGRFREDLYYRLHVIAIRLPPLRERGGDAVEIARALLAQYAAEERKQFRRLSPCAEATIAGYHWPGNVRQLQNVLRTAVVFNDGEVLTAEALPELSGPSAKLSRLMPVETFAGSRAVATDNASSDDETSDDAPSVAKIKPLAEVERDIINRAIRACNNNIARAAAALGVSPSTIYRKRQQWERGGEF